MRLDRTNEAPPFFVLSRFLQEMSLCLGSTVPFGTVPFGKFFREFRYLIFNSIS
jgi:hypothetical protein